MGYYAGFERPVARGDIDWTAVTHLAVAFSLPDGSGRLDESLGIDPVNGTALAHALVDDAHAHGLKAVAPIGGAGQHDLLASSASSVNWAGFVARLVTLVQDYGYDGVELDWEPISASDDTAIAARATALRTTPVPRPQRPSMGDTVNVPYPFLAAPLGPDGCTYLSYETSPRSGRRRPGPRPRDSDPSSSGR